MKEPGKKIVFDGTLMRKMQEKEKEDSEKIRKYKEKKRKLKRERKMKDSTKCELN